MWRVYKRSGPGMSAYVERIGAVPRNIFMDLLAVLRSFKTCGFPITSLAAYGHGSYNQFYKLWTWSVKSTLFELD